MHSFTSSPSYSLCGPLQDYSCHWSPKLQKVSFRIIIHFFSHFFFFTITILRLPGPSFTGTPFLYHMISGRGTPIAKHANSSVPLLFTSRFVRFWLSQGCFLAAGNETKTKQKRYELEVLFRYYCYGYSDCDVLQDCFLCSCLWQPNSLATTWLHFHEMTIFISVHQQTIWFMEMLFQS